MMVYQCGRHYVAVGNAEKEDDYREIMDIIGIDKIDACYTDPPYLLGKKVIAKGKALVLGGDVRSCGLGNYKIKSKRKVVFDDSNCNVRFAYENISRFTKDILIWGGNYFTDFLPPMKGWVIWNKKITAMQFSQGEMMWTNVNHPLRIYDYTWNGCVREGDKKSELWERVHPTQKPVGLSKTIISEFIPDSDTIIDPFCGSGSTLIACEELGKTGIMMDIMPYYVGVTIRRWEEYTGLEAVRIR